MNSAADRALTNYFCTGLPAAFNMRYAGLYGKIAVTFLLRREESTVLLEKGKAIIKDKLSILSVLIRIGVHNNVLVLIRNMINQNNSK